MSNARHYTDELHALVDGRLDSAMAAVVEAHVAVCAECQAEVAAIRAVTRAVRRVPAQALPDDLAAAIGRALDDEDAGVGAGGASEAPAHIGALDGPRTLPMPTRPHMSAASADGPSRRAFVRWGAAAAAVLAVGVGGWFVRSWWTGDVVATVEDDYRRYLIGRLRLDIVESDAPALERRFAEQGLLFPARVFDLGMMQYRLTGGVVLNRGDGQSAVFGYRGPTGEDVLCQMFPGTTAAATGTTDVRDHDGIRFFVHRRDDVTLVFWQEGELVCVLASTASLESVVELAFAKAMKV